MTPKPRPRTRKQGSYAAHKRSKTNENAPVEGPAPDSVQNVHIGVLGDVQALGSTTRDTRTGPIKAEPEVDVKGELSVGMSHVVALGVVSRG